MRKIALLPLLFTFLFISCDKDKDDPKEPTVELKDERHDFVWKGLNQYYLWQEDVANLADTKTDNIDDYYSFLNGYSKPEDIFESLLYKDDRFSWIVDDYNELERQFQGTSKTSGLVFQLVRLRGSDDVFGYVQYKLPNTDAETKDIKRGDFFLEVDGQQITVNNYRDLLFSDKNSYTLGMADVENNTISTNGKTVTLSLSEYTENPVFITKAFSLSGKRIGYLMYNSFTSNFEQELNMAFGRLKDAGVTDMILDLRYNGGGSVRTAKYLASMLTGQFNGKVLIKERWNSKLQNYFEEKDPASLVNYFTDEIKNKDENGNVILQEPINSLNMTKLYVITSDGTASASEMIINGLRPYIDVEIVGNTTLGKTVGSITLYDSPNFGKDNVNPNHNYAMQPIVLEIVNAEGENAVNGFDPTIGNKYNESEHLTNLGVLGDKNEPLLSIALDDITGTVSRPVETKPDIMVEKVRNSKSFGLLFQEMYVKKNINFNVDN